MNWTDLDALPTDDDDARAFVDRDGGMVPCSRYVNRFGDGLATLTLVVARILGRETGEPITYRALDNVASLIVNDSDDIARVLVDYGPEHGIGPADYLDAATL